MLPWFGKGKGKGKGSPLGRPAADTTKSARQKTFHALQGDPGQLLKPTIAEDIDRVPKRISMVNVVPRSSCQEQNGFTGVCSMGKDLKATHMAKFSQGGQIPEKNGFTGFFSK